MTLIPTALPKHPPPVAKEGEQVRGCLYLVGPSAIDRGMPAICNAWVDRRNPTRPAIAMRHATQDDQPPAKQGMVCNTYEVAAA